MKKSWIWWVPIGALSVATSVALGNPFSGSNPQPGNLTWSGFSNSSVAATISGDGGVTSDFFRFFCIDLTQSALGGPLPYTRNLGVADATNSAQLARLFDAYYPNNGSFATADESAAFQLAVWEIWFDDDLSLSTGTFQATSTASVLTWANIYLGAAASGPTPTGWTFYDFTSPDAQDYLSATYSVPLRTTPEPGTVILLCIAALTAWAAMRRRQTA